MATFKATVAYDGTDLVGWQRQASGASVQGLLEDAIFEVAGASVAVAGAGRTDAGVHALGQVATFSLDTVLTTDVLVAALNARLPRTVRVLDVAAAPDGFHARFAARSKTYRYRIWNADVTSPFERLYAWHVRGALDVDAMAEAARVLEGHHDFAAFQSAGSPVRTTDRTVFSSRLIRGESNRVGSPLIAYEVTGDGFLRHMVRAIVGTLVEIGLGRRPPASMRELLASRDRGQAGPTAPAEGLFLVKVNYALP